MSGSGSTFILVATYPDEATAREDYQVVKDAHAAGLVGSYDAAVVTKDASGKVHENETRRPPATGPGGASRPGRRSGSSSRGDAGRGRSRSVAKQDHRAPVQGHVPLAGQATGRLHRPGAGQAGRGWREQGRGHNQGRGDQGEQRPGRGHEYEDIDEALQQAVDEMTPRPPVPRDRPPPERLTSWRGTSFSVTRSSRRVEVDHRTLSTRCRATAWRMKRRR